MDVTHIIVGALVVVAAGCAAPKLAPRTPGAGDAAAVPPLTIVLSDMQAPFVSVAAELAKQWPGPVDMYRLTADPALDRATRARVQASDDKLVAAIGLPAARWARSLKGKQVVFSQVFHYREAALITPWMKGVSAVPALDTRSLPGPCTSPTTKTCGRRSGSTSGTCTGSRTAPTTR